MLNKNGVNACVLGPSLNLWQHIDVEQDRGKRLCSEAFYKSLAAHRFIDFEEDKIGVNDCVLELQHRSFVHHTEALLASIATQRQL